MGLLPTSGSPSCITRCRSPLHVLSRCESPHSGSRRLVASGSVAWPTRATELSATVCCGQAWTWQCSMQSPVRLQTSETSSTHLGQPLSQQYQSTCNARQHIRLSTHSTTMPLPSLGTCRLEDAWRADLEHHCGRFWRPLRRCALSWAALAGPGVAWRRVARL